MPAPCETALDVGCGDGILSIRLAACATQVTAIDISAEMIAIAREKSAGENVSYVEGDFLTSPLPADGFDFISAVAVVHHMRFDAALVRIASLLRRGGVLALVGLAKNSSLTDYAVSAISIPVNHLYRVRLGWWESPAPVIWPEMTYGQVERIARSLLPGAEVKRRLFFRYTLLWRKP
jgi:ubiquinone/menaquinone biosynthesis C-methylase UbiE